MKKCIVLIGSIVSLSCFMNGMDINDLRKTSSKKEKADKKGLPQINFRMSSPKTPKTPKSPKSPTSPKSVVLSGRKNSVEDGAAIPKIGTSENLKLALQQQREKAELKKSQEISPGRNT